MPKSRAASTMISTLFMPRRCPSKLGNPCFFAHRRFPSRIMPMHSGIFSIFQRLLEIPKQSTALAGLDEFSLLIFTPYRNQGGRATMHISEGFRRQLEGYGLTTAEIIYRKPDHLWLLQSYVWQEYDLYPKFPILMKFLNFWQAKLDGPLYSVMVCHSRLIRPAEIETISSEFRLH